MIRDDDLAWARKWADSGVAPHGILARLVLHVHEQEQPLPETLPMATGGKRYKAVPETPAAPLSLPPAPVQGPDRPRNEPENRIAYLPVKVTYEGLYDDTSGPYVKALVRMGPTHETTYSISEAFLVDSPLSPPPAAVEWAQMVVRDTEEHGYGPSAQVAFSEQEVISARFILTAEGKDTDE